MEKAQILIGADYFFDFVQSIRKVLSDFYVVETTVGPVVSGKAELDSGLKICKNSAQYMNTDVNNFWEMELIGIKDNSQEKEDLKAFEHFSKTLTHDKQRRYKVS